MTEYLIAYAIVTIAMSIVVSGLVDDEDSRAITVLVVLLWPVFLIVCLIMVGRE